MNFTQNDFSTEKRAKRAKDWNTFSPGRDEMTGGMSRG